MRLATAITEVATVYPPPVPSARVDVYFHNDEWWAVHFSRGWAKSIRTFATGRQAMARARKVARESYPTPVIRQT